MKKTIIAALILITGILTSCNKTTNMQKTSVFLIKTFIGDKKNLASAD